MNPSRDFTNRCGNCYAHLDEEDKYCRECGTKRGEGHFYPARNFFTGAGLYGPPMVLKYTCMDCNNKWSDSSIGPIIISKFCPKCGSKNIDNYDSKVVDFSNPEG